MAIKVRLSSSDDDSSDSWISISDMMAGLMMIFLLLAVWYVAETSEESPAPPAPPAPVLITIPGPPTVPPEIVKIVTEQEQLEASIYRALCLEFGEFRCAGSDSEDSEQSGADRDLAVIYPDLTIRFRSLDTLFERGEDKLTDHFKSVLDEVFPRYIEVLDGFSDDISEVRIEGHTSSEWEGAEDDVDAFIRNMHLSQDRTRTVLEHVLNLDGVKRYEDWTIKKVTANGLSSGRPIVDSETDEEDKERSRRVEFTVLTNVKKALSDIGDTISGQDTLRGAE